MTESMKAGVGLMAFWADIDPDYVLRYQQWHNCEHIPERVSISGFREGRRYRAVSDAPHFLMFYETETTNVLASDAYMAALNAPTDWTREALTHFRNAVRSIYSCIAVAGAHGPFAAPYVVSLRFDLPDGSEEQYVSRWIKAVAATKNVERVRLYRADAAVGSIVTSERKIYGGGPGKQVYLALIEQTLPPSEGQDAIALGDSALHIPFVRTNEELGRYWLEIAHKAANFSVKEIA